jgi:hypothetical protein
MSPGSEWKLHIRSSKVWPPTDSFSSHDSLDHALAAACLLPAHEVAVRIEGPNGEQWDQAKQRVFSPSATDAKTKLALCISGLVKGRKAYSRRQLLANAAIAASRVGS